MLIKKISIHRAQNIQILVNQLNLFNYFLSSCLRSFIFALFKINISLQNHWKVMITCLQIKTYSIHHWKSLRNSTDLVRHRDNVLDKQNYQWVYHRKMFHLFRTIPPVVLWMIHWIKLIHVLVQPMHWILRYTFVELQTYICVSYSLIVSFWVV